MQMQTQGGGTCPLLPLASAFLLMSVCCIANQLSGTEHGPASPTPLTGSEQLGWPLRGEKKKNCHWVWLEQLIKQASPVVSAPPQNPEFGVFRALEAEVPAEQSGLPSGALLHLAPDRNQKCSQDLAGIHQRLVCPERVVDPWHLGETSRTLTEDQALG